MDGRQPSLSAPEVSAPQTPDARSLKRRLGVAEELVRIKKECIEENNELYDEEHRNFTKFSKRLEAKWEQRFVARHPDVGYPSETVACESGCSQVGGKCTCTCMFV